MEGDLIQERTLDDLRTATAQGRRGGRPATADTDALAIALDRLRRGDAVTKIANQLGVGRSALYRSLGPHLSDAPDQRSASTADQDSIHSPRKAWTWILRSDDQP